MLQKNLIEKSRFRQLTTDELLAVSGGDIVVTGQRPADFNVFAFQNAQQMEAIMQMIEMFQGATQEFPDDDEWQPVGLWEDIRDNFDEIIEVIANAVGYELIDPQAQNALNSELNTKNIENVGTYHFDDGSSWNFVDTTDGVRYYDRNGDGKADLAVRDTAFGEQINTGDGAGWYFPPE